MEGDGDTGARGQGLEEAGRQEAVGGGLVVEALDRPADGLHIGGRRVLAVDEAAGAKGLLHQQHQVAVGGDAVELEQAHSSAFSLPGIPL